RKAAAPPLIFVDGSELGGGFISRPNPADDSCQSRVAKGSHATMKASGARRCHVFVDDTLQQGHIMPEGRRRHVGILATFVPQPDAHCFLEMWVALEFGDFLLVHRPTLQAQRMNRGG